MFKSPGHIAFSLGNIDVHWYGIIMSLSILSGLVVMLLLRKKYFKDISIDSICDISFILIIIGIISARLYYILLDYNYFLRNPFEIIAIWNGGISIQGAIAGGIIAGAIYTAKHKLNFFRYADLFSFGLIIGQILGRWGNFFNSEAFGSPTNLPWKLFIPYTLRPLEFKTYEYFHPAFLYESVLNFVVFLILLFILTKCKERKDGLIFFFYIFLYSTVRIIVEFIRVDSVLNIYNIHIAHIASVIFIIIAIYGIFFIQKKSKIL